MNKDNEDERVYEGLTPEDRQKIVDFDLVLHESFDKTLELYGRVISKPAVSLEELNNRLAEIVERTINVISYEVLLLHILVKGIIREEKETTERSKKDLDFLNEMIKLMAGNQTHFGEDIEDIRDRQKETNALSQQVMAEINKYFKEVEEKK